MTMYSNKLAVAIKTAGKVLKEQGDKVFLPFGSEYSIFLKNLNSVRALVRVSIDGTSVTDGEDLVIHGNSELNLERFLKKGNMNSGNRFKFIERSGKVEQHRGIGAEDGLLRVEFQFEKIPPKVEEVHKHVYEHHHKYYDPHWYGYKPYWYNPYYYGSGYSIGCDSSYHNAGSSSINTLGVASGGTTETLLSNCATGASASNATFTSTSSGHEKIVRSRAMKSKSVAESNQPAQVFLNQVNQDGITVAGSVSDQKFVTASWFAVEDQTHVIVLKLLGEVGGQTVSQPVLARKKQTCTVCGTRNRGSNQFCRECGAALEIVGQSPGRVAIT